MGKYSPLISTLSIIIPVYNEAATVVELLNRVCQQPLESNLQKEILIVESNSTDGSLELVKKFVADNPKFPLKLILQDRPRGKGYAIREGLQLATGDVVLIQDSDLEYDTADYDVLIDPIMKGHADFVLGSRHLAAGTWKIRRFEQDPLKAWYMNLGGSLFHFFFNHLYGVKLTDPTTMYKVFLRSCINGVSFECNRFDFDFELLGKLIRLGYLPIEVPITYTSRGFEEGKKVNVWRDPFSWLKAIVKYRFLRIRRTSRAEAGELRAKSLDPTWSDRSS